MRRSLHGLEERLNSPRKGCTAQGGTIPEGELQVLGRGVRAGGSCRTRTLQGLR